LDSGIYEIAHRATGKRYIGQSAQLEERRKRHWRDLARGHHSNPKLQRAVNKYGLEEFEWRVLEYVSLDGLSSEMARALLAEREQHHFDQTPSDKSLQCAPAAGSTLGMRFSEEAKRNVSAGIRAAYSRPGGTDNLRASWSDPETRERRMAAVQRRSQKSSWRENQSAAMKEITSKEEWRAKNREAVKRNAATPEWREKQRQGLRNFWLSESAVDSRVRRSEAAATRFANMTPEQRRAHAAKATAARSKKRSQQSA